ncbi:MAG: hypothetical protein RL088_856 [Verrucomicrobiota bacterium]
MTTAFITNIIAPVAGFAAITGLFLVTLKAFVNLSPKDRE